MAIKDSNIAADASIDVGKIGFPYLLSGKHTDGTLPKVFWVAKGGADGSYNGTRQDPLLTIDGATGAQGALSRVVNGRGDRVIVGPGIWRENVDIGSAVRNRKRDVGLFGSGGAHPGRTQIVSDGTTTGPTIRVRDGYLRGLILANFEVGNVNSSDADRAQPFMDLETDDTGSLTADSNDEWAVLRNINFSGGGTGTYGLILTGATMVRAYELHFQGCVVGIYVRGSLQNRPENCYFEDLDFIDNVTADIGADGASTEGVWRDPPLLSTGQNATSVRFLRSRHWDRGGTPVTNYVNWGGGTGAGTVVNCGMFDAEFARAVADGTLLQIPVDFVVTGRSAAAAVNIIGA